MLKDASTNKSYNHPPTFISYDIQVLRYNALWLARLMAIKNTIFPATCKILLIGLKEEIDRVERVSKVDRREDGLTPVYIPNLEALTGLSRQQIGDNLKAMANAGVIRRKCETANTGNKRVYCAISPATLQAPSEIALTEETGRGGKRTKKAKQERIPCCPDCGSYDVTVTTQREILCRTEGVITVVPTGKPKVYSSHDHDIIVPPTQEELDALPPTMFSELPQDAPAIVKEVERPYATDDKPQQIAANNWEDWSQALRPQPPLVCHGGACHNTNPDKFRWLDLLAQYECSLCGLKARGR